MLMLAPRDWRLSISVPLQTFLLAPSRGVAVLRRLSADLRSENARLARLAADLAVENARLSSPRPPSSEMPQQPEAILTTVIGRDPSTLRSWLIVDCGTNNGVATGCPVIAPAGVVGLVVAAGRNQALVQTLLNPATRVSVINRRSRVPALARHDGHDRVALDYVASDADFRVGDTIVTAGFGGVFPKSLHVGIVCAIPTSPGAMFQDVQVQPLADILRTEYVFVLRPPGASSYNGIDAWRGGDSASPEVSFPRNP